MPYALVLIGLLMIITGINNTYSQFAAQVQADMTGSNGGRGFIAWIVALFLVGALGYVNALRTFSHYFLALILISMILSNKGVFAQLQKAAATGPVAPTASAEGGSPVTTEAAITANQTGPFGSRPQSPGQAKAFGWFNYIFGFSTNSAGAAP